MDSNTFEARAKALGLRGRLRTASRLGVVLTLFGLGVIVLRMLDSAGKIDAPTIGTWDYALPLLAGVVLILAGPAMVTLRADPGKKDGRSNTGADQQDGTQKPPPAEQQQQVASGSQKPPPAEQQQQVASGQPRPGLRSRFRQRMMELWHGVYPAKLWEFLLLGTLVVVVGVLIKWAYFTDPEIIIEDVAMPKTLVERGYSGRLLAGQIADEIRNIQRVGNTSKEPIYTELLQLKPDVEVRATVFTLGSIMSFVRSSVGREDHVVSASLYCTNEKKLVLALEGSYAHRGTLREDVPHVHILHRAFTVTDSTDCEAIPKPGSAEAPATCGDDGNASVKATTFEDLPKCAAREVIKAFDPYFLAVYLYERAKYYEGIRLLGGSEKLLNGVDLQHAYGVPNVEVAASRRDEERNEAIKIIKYCLGLDVSGVSDDQPDKRNIPYDKHTRARALNLWGLFDVLDASDPNFDKAAFQRAEERFAEATQLADSDPSLKGVLAFIYSNWGDIHFAWTKEQQDGEEQTEHLYKDAIRNSDKKDGYASWGELLVHEARLGVPTLREKQRKYRAARTKFRASIENYEEQPTQEESEIYRELGYAESQMNVGLEEAIRKYRKAIEINAAWAPTYVSLSWALYKKYGYATAFDEQELQKYKGGVVGLYCRAVSLYRVYPNQFPDKIFDREVKDEFDELWLKFGEPAKICAPEELALSPGSQTGSVR